MTSYISTATNRNPLTWAFMTFPQSDLVTKDDLLATMQPLGPYVFYCFVIETHKDGQPHLHALVKFETPVSKSKILKHLKVAYPTKYKRIQVGRIVKNSSPYCAYQYLLKEDGNPLLYGPPPKKKSPFTGMINKFALDQGFPSVEAMLVHHTSYRKSIDSINTQLLLCIHNIDSYSSLYPFTLPYPECDIYSQFVNFDYDISRTKFDIRQTTLQKFINKYSSSQFTL